MIFTDKIVTNRLINETLDTTLFTPAQLQMIHNLGIKIFAAGYDIGRLDNPKWKPVLQCDKNTGKVIDEFPSMLHAMKKTGVSQGHISRAIRGERAYAGGYLWRYKNLEDYEIY